MAAPRRAALGVGAAFGAGLGEEEESDLSDAEPAEIAWLDANLVPLAGCDPDLDLQDLAPLADAIGDARIVGLGESTHGTREHFQLKHRLVRWLVEEHGFDVFAIEASTPEAHRLDAYVLGEVDSDPRELIGGMYFWTWNTEEVLAMVAWMREHNAGSEHKVHFTGFDMQTPDVAATLELRGQPDVAKAPFAADLPFESIPFSR